MERLIKWIMKNWTKRTIYLFYSHVFSLNFVVAQPNPVRTKASYAHHSPTLQKLNMRHMKTSLS